MKWGILGAGIIMLSKVIDEYAFIYGSNFYETDVTRSNVWPLKKEFYFRLTITKVCTEFKLHLH